MEKFWMVWNPARGMPRVQHPNKVAASNEANRLAGIHAGEVFYVIEAVTAHCTEAPKVVTITLEESPSSIED
jgi:hypothetical protein